MPPLSALQPKPWDGRGSPVLHACSKQTGHDTVAGFPTLGSRRKAKKKKLRKGSAHALKLVPKSSNISCCIQYPGQHAETARRHTEGRSGVTPARPHTRPRPLPFTLRQGSRVHYQTPLKSSGEGPASGPLASKCFLNRLCGPAYNGTQRLLPIPVFMGSSSSSGL